MNCDRNQYCLSGCSSCHLKDVITLWFLQNLWWTFSAWITIRTNTICQLIFFLWSPLSLHHYPLNSGLWQLSHVCQMAFNMLIHSSRKTWSVITKWKIPNSQLDRGCPNRTNTPRGDNFSRYQNLHCDLDLWPFDLKIYRAHPCLMGSLHVKFHDDRCKGEQVMRRKPFSVIYALWPWPLTFWTQNL